MAVTPGLIVRMKMECLDRAWELVDDNRKALFKGNVHFTLTLLEHLEAPTKVFETRI